MKERGDYFYTVRIERQDKINRIPFAVANKELKKQLKMKLNRFIQHSREVQLNKKRMHDLDIDTIIRQIKKSEFDQRVRRQTVSKMPSNQLDTKSNQGRVSRD